MRKCAECGADMVSGGFERTINEGTPEERIICEQCFDDMWDKNRITMCNNCGRWFDVGQIHSIGEIGGDTFAPCPFCGHDIVDGDSVEDRKANERPFRIKDVNPRRVFAVVSFRQYENEERYYGCDGIFLTYDAAREYIISDMKETLTAECEGETLQADFDDFTIDACSHYYSWQIDPVYVAW